MVSVNPCWKKKKMKKECSIKIKKNTFEGGDNAEEDSKEEDSWVFDDDDEDSCVLELDDEDCGRLDEDESSL